VFKDCWLLTIGADEWVWEPVEVNNVDSAPSQLWCHSACKVSTQGQLLPRLLANLALQRWK